MADTAKETVVDTKVTEVAKVEDTVDLDFEVESLGDNPTDEDKDKAIATLTAQKKHWRTKFEGTQKTEKPDEKKEDKKTETAKSELSQSDLITLIKADINEADIPEVVEYANMKKISIAEALKSNVVQAILDTNKEARTVADATNTDKSNKSISGTSDEELVANAKKGILPESDEDMSRLARLRLGIKK